MENDTSTNRFKGREGGLWNKSVDQARPAQPPQPQQRPLSPCCIKTIDLHAQFNPMMVCPECKQVIKCFKEESAYKNYVRFCLSRNRKISVTKFSDLHVVLFHAFADFG